MLAFEDADRLLCTHVSTNTQIHTFRLSNLQFTGGFRVSSTAFSNMPLEFVKFDTNRAILLLSRATLVEPMAFAATRADLGLSTVVSPEPVPMLGEFAVTITVTNHGPHAATEVKLTNQLTGASRVSVAASQGTVASGEASTVAELGTIPAGSSARVTIFARADEPRDPSNVSWVTAKEADPDATDDFITVKMRAAAPTRGPRERIYPIDVTALAAFDNSRKLFATTDALAGKIGNAVLRIDPATGVIEQTNVVGLPLGKIAISADQQFAYVSALGWSNFGRVNLASGGVDWAFTAGGAGHPDYTRRQQSGSRFRHVRAAV
jgi:uncharacterized repeat protein (TIGR01451 family)